MKNIEVKEFLTCDYIYLPYKNKEDLYLNSSGAVFKCDKIGEVSLPVSGLAIGTTKIYSLNSIEEVLVIENDFKDKIKQRKLAVKDIYSLSESDVKKCVNISKTVFALKIEKKSKSDLRDYCLLKDYTRELLETLNLIDNVYKNIKVKIILDKKDFESYEILFNYMGTYPNIEIEFASNKVKNYEEISVLSLIDLYNKIKNSVVRDFIYLTVETKKRIDVIKVKKYSNLKETLNYLGISKTKIIANLNKTLTNENLLLDDSVYLISVI